MPSSPDVGGKDKPHRKAAHLVHKANTIGIPSEADFNISDPKLLSPVKPRMNIFEGFRNTLRSKHKSDTAVLDSKEGEKDDIHRRWSEANQPTVSFFIFICPYYFFTFYLVNVSDEYIKL